MKIRNSRSFFPAAAAIGWAVWALLLTFSVPEASSQTPSASPNGKKDLKRRFDLQIDYMLNSGRAKQFEVEHEVSSPLGMTAADSIAPWIVVGRSAFRKPELSVHTFAVSRDGKDVYLVFKPADESYSIHWLTDPDGRLRATVYSVKKTRTTGWVDNRDYATEFENEKAYWDRMFPASAPTAAPRNR